MDKYYYTRNISHFNKNIDELTLLERGIGHELISLYYNIEGPLPLDVKLIYRLISASSPEEATVLEKMLNNFFVRTSTGWVHPRCEEELAELKNKQPQEMN